MDSAAWENVHRATMELAKSTPIKQRLTDAFSRYLLELDATAVPRALWPDFESLKARMTAVRPLRGETAVAATVRKMSLDEADECAASIVGLLDQLHRLPSALPVRGGGKDSGTSRQRAVLRVNNG